MPEDTVHGLLSQRPLCEFSNLVPSHWPAGHTFVEAIDVKNMTCKKCREGAEKLLKKSNDFFQRHFVCH